MGLLDSLIGAAGQALGAQSGQPGGLDIGSLVGGLVNHFGGQGGAGLAGLLQQLQAAGLGDHVQSWIGQGANIPVSADQITAALGGDGGLLGQLAQHLGQSHDDTAGHLAQALPELVNHLTPNGQLPATDTLSQLLDSLTSAAASPGR